MGWDSVLLSVMSFIKVKDYSPPIRDILYNKGIANLNLCHSYPETVEHLVIKCDLARRVWFSFIGVEVNRWTFGSPIEIIKQLVGLEASNTMFLVRT